MESATRLARIPIATALALTLLTAGLAVAETVEIEGSTGVHGISLQTQSPAGVEVHFEMTSFRLDALDIEGATHQKVTMPQVFLPNDAGAPDLPGMGRFVAIPQGCTPSLEIIATSTRTYQGVEIAPAPVLPRENDDSPLVYAKNANIYQRDAFYPESPAIMSEPGRIRGVDVVTVGFTPFQYNPVTKELVVFTELDVRVEFQGGTGIFGEERLRTRYWESILENHLLNYATLPAIDFNRTRSGNTMDSRTGCEYIILCPDDPSFIAWADTLASWRKLEGIDTDVFTTTDVGGTSAPIIESWLNDAYDTWNPAPDAFLLLGDYPNSGDLDTGITSPTWNGYCISDNIYADRDGDDLPDMVHARITARDAAELETMIGKMLSYEREPYTDPAFYDRPVIAGGWQTERWFVVCTEIVLGHQQNVLGKSPVREYAIYSGSPTTWSTNQNTYMLMDYFGTPPTYPNGLGYIPDTPAHLTDWGANSTRLNDDINAGTYMILHRDHGLETGWGEPHYRNEHLAGLHNEMYPFVFSINCLTGKYNYGSESFTEAFHRMGYGALGLIAASEISYSFVNDTYIFGMFDTMWPEFMPTYGPFEPYNRFATDLRPAFGNAGAKHFLHSSAWPYNTSNKDETYHLFHHHGDAFMRMNSEVPTHMAINHGGVLFLGLDTFTVQAELGALIALTVDGEIVGVADANGMPQDITIEPQVQPGDLRVVVTKANRFRYDAIVPIVPPDGPYLVFDGCQVIDTAGDGDGILDAGETPDLDISLENVGVEQTTGVTATLTSTDTNVNITTATQPYPNIPAGGVFAGTNPFEIEVAGNTPDGHTIQFMVTATANEGQWESSFALAVEAPVLAAGDLATDDTGPGGNSNGRPDPGDVITVSVTLSNTGHSDSPELTGTLTTTHPDVAITGPAATCPSVAVGGVGSLGDFTVEILASCPTPTQIPVEVLVTADNGFTALLLYEIPVGPWFDNAEQNRGWTLGAPGDNATSGHWIRDDPVGTEYNSLPVQPEDDHTADPGVICFVTGNATPGAGAGTNDVDGGHTTLLSPVFDLSNAVSAELSYWRWYTNDAGNNPDEDYWTVAATDDGVSWVNLEYTLESAASWNQYTFDVSQHVSFTDHFQVRFIADDTIGGSLVEAAVDDFMFDIILQGSAAIGPDEVDAIRKANGITSISPNPFNPATKIEYRVGVKTDVSLKIYDVHGRMVRTLVEDTVEAGDYTIAFDGRSTSGTSLASGIYFLRLETPEIMQVRQIALVK